MTSSDTKHIILNALSTGEFVSGEKLGIQIGISRAAIAKHIASLNELGLDIFSVTGKGYRLPDPLVLLDRKYIIDSYQKLSNNIRQANENPKLEVHSVLDSTNAELMRKLRGQELLDDGHTILAECQTAGRGRRGKTWISPFGSHVYLSRYYKADHGLAEASGLSISIGIAVSRAIDKYCGEVTSLKWPNDLLINNQKVAGILVEAEGQSDGHCHLIIGVGINVTMPIKSAENIDQAWTDLSEHVDVPLSRNDFIATLMSELDQIINTYREDRLDSLFEIWNKKNAFKGQVVKLASVKDEKVGKCLGIDTNGALLIELEKDKSVFKSYGGEVSLRRVVK